MDEDRDDPAALSTSDLEARLSCLAARIAAAECEFLTLLAEFDARQGWGESGMKSTAHWLSWRTGMRLGVARERVRVARALRALPLVREAFAAGRLSYCKVRALSRVATAPTEPELVEIALGATGGQLERIARAWQTCLIGQTSASAHLRRGLRRREDEDGSVVYTLRVAPEEGAVIDAALLAARTVVLDEQGHPVETPEESAIAEAITDQSAAQRAQADAFVLIAESYLATGPAGQPGDHTTVLVHTDLATLTAATDLVAAAPPHAAPDRPTTPEPTPPGGSLEQHSLATRPPGAALEGGARLATATMVRMLCQSPTQLMVHAADGRPLDLGRTRRHASRAQRTALRVRDGGCRFPGCTQRRRLIPHHVHWWTHGGPTDLDNLVLLCPTHHRAVHEVGYSVVALGQDRFAFHKPDGRPLPATGNQSADPNSPLTEAPVTPDTITPDTITPDTITPDTITPDTITPDTITPDTITPDTITPQLGRRTPRPRPAHRRPRRQHPHPRRPPPRRHPLPRPRRHPARRRPLAHPHHSTAESRHRSLTARHCWFSLALRLPTRSSLRRTPWRSAV